MKTKKQLLDEATFNGNWQTSSGNKAILECLCDIRLFLANITSGSSFRNSEVLTKAKQLIEDENQPEALTE